MDGAEYDEMEEVCSAGKMRRPIAVVTSVVTALRVGGVVVAAAWRCRGTPRSSLGRRGYGSISGVSCPVRTGSRSCCRGSNAVVSLV